MDKEDVDRMDKMFAARLRQLGLTAYGDTAEDAQESLFKMLKFAVRVRDERASGGRWMGRAAETSQKLNREWKPLPKEAPNAK